MEKVWNVEDIREVLNEISEKMGVSCSKSTIEITKRMTKCKGKCNMIGKKIAPGEYLYSSEKTKFKFSYYLVNGSYKPEDVRQTIIHEYIHFYTNFKMKRPCNHNKYFKYFCRLAGISDETYFTAKPVDGTTKVRGLEPKYLIKCKDCGNEFTKMRFGKGKEYYLSRYVCAKCRGKLEVFDL